MKTIEKALAEKIERLEEQLSTEKYYCNLAQKQVDNLTAKLQARCKHEKFYTATNSTSLTGDCICAICGIEKPFEEFVKLGSKLVGGFE